MADSKKSDKKDDKKPADPRAYYLTGNCSDGSKDPWKKGQKYTGKNTDQLLKQGMLTRHSPSDSKKLEAEKEKAKAKQREADLEASRLKAAAKRKGAAELAAKRDAGLDKERRGVAAKRQAKLLATPTARNRP